jgi:hypothetical protein
VTADELAMEDEGEGVDASLVGPLGLRASDCFFAETAAPAPEERRLPSRREFSRTLGDGLGARAEWRGGEGDAEVESGTDQSVSSLGAREALLRLASRLLREVECEADLCAGRPRRLFLSVLVRSLMGEALAALPVTLAEIYFLVDFKLPVIDCKRLVVERDAGKLRRVD